MHHRSVVGLCSLVVVAFSQMAALCGGNNNRGGGNNPLRDAVVFDIDGTLTEAEFDFFDDRAYAVEAVEAWRDLGYEVVVLTRRPAEFEIVTRAWLIAEGFPADLPLYMADGILLFDGQVIDFKRDALLEIEQDEKLNFEYAYGNMTTDFTAYAQAGIPSAHVFALAEDGHCESGAWVACLDGFAGHLPYIEAQPPGQ
jgi:phosphatidate phosphatase PAH1